MPAFRAGRINISNESNNVDQPKPNQPNQSNQPNQNDQLKKPMTYKEFSNNKKGKGVFKKEDQDEGDALHQSKAGQMSISFMYFFYLMGFYAKKGFRSTKLFMKIFLKKRNHFSILISLLIILILCGYLIMFKNSDKLSDFQKYSGVFYVLNAVLFIAFVLLVYTFADKGNKDFKKDGKYDVRMGKAHSEEEHKKNRFIKENFKQFMKDYLNTTKPVIALIIILAVLTIIYSGIQNAKDSFALMKKILIGLGIVAGTFFLYFLLPKLPIIKKLLNKKLFRAIFNTILFIPCLFGELVKIIYNEYRYTPKIIYKVLLVQIIIIGLYIFVPIMTSILYKILFRKNNTIDILKKKIESTKQSRISLMRKINKIINNKAANDSYKIREHNEQGSISNENKIFVLPKVAWNRIMEKFLYKKSNEIELKKYLFNYGYRDSNDCKNETNIEDREHCNKKLNLMIDYIQKNAIIIKNTREEHERLGDTIDSLKKQLKESSSIFNNAKILIDKPKNIDERLSVLQPTEYLIRETNDMVSYDFAVSMWIFINSNPANYRTANTKFTEIMSFDNQPRVLYNPEKNIMKIQMKNGNSYKTSVIRTIPLQKWNNLVINYTNGIYDIFFNGNLVSSLNNIIPINNISDITIGSKDGLTGGICNLTYFPKSLSAKHIIRNYKSLVDVSPPVIKK